MTPLENAAIAYVQARRQGDIGTAWDRLAAQVDARTRRTTPRAELLDATTVMADHHPNPDELTDVNPATALANARRSFTRPTTTEET